MDWQAPQGSGTAEEMSGTEPTGIAARPTFEWAPPSGAAEVPAAVGFVYAGAGVRLVAYIVDSFLVWLAFVIVMFVAVMVALWAAVGFGRAEAIALSTVVVVAIDFLYFLAFWTSRGRATLAQRLFKMEVRNAADGRTLWVAQAVRRWVALGTPLRLLAVLPALADLSSTGLLVWSIVLLVTTASSSTKQGLHDRFAGSVVVRPAGHSANPVVILVIVLLVLLVLLPILAIMALIFFGGVISEILMQISEALSS